MQITQAGTETNRFVCLWLLAPRVTCAPKERQLPGDRDSPGERSRPVLQPEGALLAPCRAATPNVTLQTQSSPNDANRSIGKIERKRWRPGPAAAGFMRTKPCWVLTSLSAEGGGGRCCGTHAVSWNHLSLWGYRWGQLWTRKLSLDIPISAVLPRAHAHPLSLPVHLE